MRGPLNPALTASAAPPIMAVRGWLSEVDLPASLIDLSQAAPALPPPERMRAAMAEAVLRDPDAHLYAPVLGLPALREALANRTGALYGGTVEADQVAITSGCNEAFAAALHSVASAGEDVILVSPWYFNHKMWCDMNGIRAIPLPVGPDLLPDADQAATLFTERTRALVLVSPNNPCGVEYPPDLIRTLHDLAARHGAALILDETYRDFRRDEGAPHDLFASPSETFIHLYSFSKAYRLTGHRVGAIVTGAPRIAEIEKFLDTVTICATPLGQMGALWGMTHLEDWLAGERAEILARRVLVEEMFRDLPDWQIHGAGAYFAWISGPQDGTATARRLLSEVALLTLPGAMFAPSGDMRHRWALRLAFANCDRAALGDVATRLRAFAA